MGHKDSNKSIRNLAPLERGGVAARQGLDFQDHVAARFFLSLLTESLLLEVWCETHDDITLIWETHSGALEVEFVQVKNNELDHLWSISELCNRRVSSNRSTAKSIFERSLANDRCLEKTHFRIVTSRDVNSTLRIFKLPFSAPDRLSAVAQVRQIAKEIKQRNSLTSENGNDASYWTQHLLWEVKHSIDDLRHDNEDKLHRLVEQMIEGMIPKRSISVLYDLILNEVHRVAKANWGHDSRSKKITKSQAKEILLSFLKGHSSVPRHNKIKTCESEIGDLVYQIAGWNGRWSEGITCYRERFEVLRRECSVDPFKSWLETIFAAFLVKACVTSTEGSRLFWNEVNSGHLFRLCSLASSNDKVWRCAANYLYGRILTQVAVGADERVDPKRMYRDLALYHRHANLVRSLDCYDAITDMAKSDFPLLLPGIRSECPPSMLLDSQYQSVGTDPLVKTVPIPRRYRALQRCYVAWSHLAQTNCVHDCWDYAQAESLLKLVKSDLDSAFRHSEESLFIEMNLTTVKGSLLAIESTQRKRKARRQCYELLTNCIDQIATHKALAEIPWAKQKEWLASWSATLAYLSHNERAAQQHLDRMERNIDSYALHFGHFNFAEIDVNYSLLRLKPAGRECLNAIMQRITNRNG